MRLDESDKVVSMAKIVEEEEVIDEKVVGE